MSLHGGFRLLAFVVPSRNHPELPPPTEQQADGPDGDLRRVILNRLSPLLPSHAVPDALLLVPALPLTPHGE